MKLSSTMTMKDSEQGLAHHESIGNRLKVLVKRGLLERQGEKKATSYSLTNKARRIMTETFKAGFLSEANRRMLLSLSDKAKIKPRPIEQRMEEFRDAAGHVFRAVPSNLDGNTELLVKVYMGKPGAAKNEARDRLRSDLWTRERYGIPLPPSLAKIREKLKEK